MDPDQTNVPRTSGDVMAPDDAALAAWSMRIGQAHWPIDLPSRTRRGDRSGASAIRFRVLEDDLVERLAAIASELSASLFAAVFAAFQVLVSRYTGKDVFLVASDFAARLPAGVAPAGGTHGLLCAELAGEITFRRLVRQVETDLVFARQHHQRLAALREQRFERAGTAIDATAGLSFSQACPGISLPRSGSIHLAFHDRPGAAGVECRYPADRHAEAEIDQFLDHLCLLLERLASDARAPVSRHPILDGRQQRQVLDVWNGTGGFYPAERTIQDLFEAQAAAAPDADALFCSGRTISYAALNRQANRLARHLRRQGIAPGAVVGVCVPRSFEMVVALLAILKSGAGYLPFDDALPQDRLLSMLDDAGVESAVTVAPVRARYPALCSRVIILDEAAIASEPYSDANLLPSAGAADIAYVNYTSGSTGKPKGVAIRHRSVARLVFGCSYAQLDRSRRILQLATPSFDALTFELWGPLLHGGCCVLYDGQFPTLPKLRETIRSGRVDTVFLTTALFNTIIDEAPDLLMPVEQLLTGGEAHSVAHMRKALTLLPGTRISSVYGPTENTTFTTHYPVQELPDGAASIPIGRPIGNTQAFVLDQHRHLAAVGVVGELYVGGAGLAAGYLGQPELTVERFVRNLPFLPPDHVLYRTGDLVRWLPDGILDFVGRADGQVKLHGYRIELGEIEARLMGHPDVKQAAVIVHEVAHDNRRLIALVVGRAGDPGAGQLRSHLARSLPKYMVPAEFRCLQELPLNRNGKIDRKALAALVAGETDRPAAPSASAGELGT